MSCDSFWASYDAADAFSVEMTGIGKGAGDRNVYNPNESFNHRQDSCLFPAVFTAPARYARLSVRINGCLERQSNRPEHKSPPL